MNPILKALLRTANMAASWLYRRSDGRIGGTARGLPVCLVTIPGRRSGAPHTVPVVYFDNDNDNEYVVAASAGGSKPEPQWIRNAAATNSATVQMGASTILADVRVPEPAERDRLWADVVLARAPFFADYERKSGRTIRVAVLTPRRETPDSGQGPRT